MSQALQLLTNDGRQASFLSDIWAPLSCGIFGFGAMCFVNFGTRRPVFSGMIFLYNFIILQFKFNLNNFRYPEAPNCNSYWSNSWKNTRWLAKRSLS